MISFSVTFADCIGLAQEALYSMFFGQSFSMKSVQRTLYVV
jgi:hypothetical protein